jgi:hypothetical protein
MLKDFRDYGSASATQTVISVTKQEPNGLAGV